MTVSSTARPTTSAGNCYSQCQCCHHRTPILVRCSRHLRPPMRWGFSVRTQTSRCSPPPPHDPVQPHAFLGRMRRAGVASGGRQFASRFAGQSSETEIVNVSSLAALQPVDGWASPLLPPLPYCCPPFPYCYPLSRTAAPLSPTATPSPLLLLSFCVPYVTICVLASQQYHRHDLASRLTLN